VGKWIVMNAKEEEKEEDESNYIPF